MIENTTREKIFHVLLPLSVVLGIYAFLAAFFDFYYDLNDDMLIKDILSGAFSSIPDGHTNQMLYPLGLFLSFLYRLMPKAPVFGGFLCFCFGVCLWMIFYRMQQLFEKKRGKIAADLLLAAAFLALMMWELVYVQYSVVCGVMAGTACFWFYTTNTDCSVRKFWLRTLPALLLVWMAFLIRSEMLLLTGPFIAAVGICQWAEAAKLEEEKDNGIVRKKNWKYVLSKNNLKKYIGFVVVFLLGLLLFKGMDSLAYRENDWQEYREFFDARTKVYDYTWYPDYEKQKEFYEKNKISYMQYQLLDNYNFGLDTSITANTLKQIASFNEKSKLYQSRGEHVKKAVWELGKRSFSLSDAPYNCFVWIGYGFVAGLAVLQKEKKYIYNIMLLLVMRCIPWMYLIYVGRVVDRIAHPLYIIEFLILLAILVKELYDRPLWNAERYFRLVFAGSLALAAAVCLPFEVGKVKEEQNRREQIVSDQQRFHEYAKSNPQNFYYFDVYSTVSFVEKMFENVDNTQKNYDLMGGWMCNSPLQKKVRKAYVASSLENEGKKATTMAEALLLDNFYFVIRNDREASFVIEYYKTQEKEVQLSLVESLGDEEGALLIYQICEK